VYAERGDLVRVRAVVDRAVVIWRKELPPDHWRIANSQAALGLCLVKERKYTEAEAVLLPSYATLEKQRGAESADTRRVRGWLVKLYEDWGRPESAARYRLPNT
jgi:serine/threonine-protein kinase